MKEDDVWTVVGVLDSGVAGVRRNTDPGRHFSRTIRVTNVDSQTVPLQQDTSDSVVYRIMFILKKFRSPRHENGT